MTHRFEFEYIICRQFDADLFQKQCAALEKYIPNLKREPLVEDVDGSQYQHYQHERGEIVVANDYDIGCLYVESNFDLLPYFSR